MPSKSLSPSVVRLLAALLLAVPAHALGGDGSSCPHHPKGTTTAAEPPTTEVRLVDAELLDTEGKPLRFRSEALGDTLVVLDFVYTTCTTVCPVLSAVFARVQGRLGDRLGTEVQLVSLTVDPTRDTPARLKAYSTQLGAKAGWRWLTGRQDSVRQVLVGLGAYKADFANHSPMVLVGDPRTGTWARLNGFPTEEQILAKVDELAAARRNAALLAVERD
jgi:cytochrome oxidase Cu insertion factor (SCO1/SenC/PrrC family)